MVNVIGYSHMADISACEIDHQIDSITRTINETFLNYIDI